MIAEQERLDITRRAVAAVNTGVDYDRRKGVDCPACGVNHLPNSCGVYRTMPWGGGERVRYHKCPLCTCSFSSVEKN